MITAVLTIDRDADAAYLRLGDGKVARTVGCPAACLLTWMSLTLLLGSKYSNWMQRSPLSSWFASTTFRAPPWTRCAPSVPG